MQNKTPLYLPLPSQNRPFSVKPPACHSLSPGHGVSMLSRLCVGLQHVAGVASHSLTLSLSLMYTSVCGINVLSVIEIWH